MKHKQKVKLAKKMLSKEERKKKTPIFKSNNWKTRKLSIQKRITNKKTMRKYQIRDRESGNITASTDSLSVAKIILNKYIAEDKKDGIYAANFYEIYDTTIEKVIIIK